MHPQRMCIARKLTRFTREVDWSIARSTSFSLCPIWLKYVRAAIIFKSLVSFEPLKRIGFWGHYSIITIRSQSAGPQSPNPLVHRCISVPGCASVLRLQGVKAFDELLRQGKSRNSAVKSAQCPLKLWFLLVCVFERCLAHIHMLNTV